MTTTTPPNNPPFIPAYVGIPTFMRAPFSQSLDDVDIAMVGVPFDSGAVSWRSGTRFGPESIRKHSKQIWGYNRYLDIAPIFDLKTIDYGDIECDPTNIDRASQEISAAIQAILHTDTRILSFGGDHSISYPLLHAHAKVHGPLAVLHLDSHTDCYRYITQLEHGTPFWLSIRDGFIDTSAYIQVGIRGPQSTRGEIEEAQALGAQVITIEDCFELGTKALIEQIRRRIGDRKLYISLDIDSIDPAFAPGTGTPEVGGFSSFQMLQILRGLNGINLVGADVVEVNPQYDHGGITSILAANLGFELISLMGNAIRKAGG